MPHQDDDLPFGLYERLLTARLKARLLRFDPASARVVTNGLDPADAHATLKVGRTVLAERHVDKVKIGHAIGLHGSPSPDTGPQSSELGGSTKPRPHRRGGFQRRRRLGSRA